MGPRLPAAERRDQLRTAVLTVCSRDGYHGTSMNDVAVAAAAHGPSGMGVEHKGLSLTLHYRAREDLEDEVVVFDDVRQGDFFAIAVAARALYSLMGSDSVA